MSPHLVVCPHCGLSQSIHNRDCVSCNCHLGQAKALEGYAQVSPDLGHQPTILEEALEIRPISGPFGPATHIPQALAPDCPACDAGGCMAEEIVHAGKVNPLPPIPPPPPIDPQAPLSPYTRSYATCVFPTPTVSVHQPQYRQEVYGKLIFAIARMIELDAQTSTEPLSLQKVPAGYLLVYRDTSP